MSKKNQIKQQDDTINSLIKRNSELEDSIEEISERAQQTRSASFDRYAENRKLKLIIKCLLEQETTQGKLLLSPQQEKRLEQNGIKPEELLKLI